MPEYPMRFPGGLRYTCPSCGKLTVDTSGDKPKIVEVDP